MVIPSTRLLEKLDTHQLPSLDHVLIELIDACNQGDVAYERLAEIIKKDAALTVKVLTIVNSSMYAQAKNVSSLERALITLGVETIRVIAITSAIRKTLAIDKLENVVDLKFAWKKSLYCALISKSIAKLVGYRSQDETYIIGLLHNVGELVLACNFPGEYRYLHPASGAPLAYQEKNQFGFNSCEVGAWLVDQWQLRSFSADAILYQNEPVNQVEGAHVLVKIIWLGGRLATDAINKNEEWYETGNRFFGLKTGLIQQLVTEADRKVTSIAQSLHVDLGDIRKLSPSNSIDAQPITEEISIQQSTGVSQLAERVKEEAALNSVLPLFDSANTDSRLLQSIQLAVNILFGIRHAMIFLLDKKEYQLIGMVPNREDSFINQLKISRSDEKSILIETLNTGTPIHSFENTIHSTNSIIDRQIVRLASTDGILTLPMKTANSEIGVLVLGIEKFRLSDYEKQFRLMTKFAAASATSLALRQHVQKHIRSEQNSVLSPQKPNKLKNIVHEANNPLSIIKKYITILSSNLGEQHGEELAIISSELDRIKRIIQEIPSRQSGDVVSKLPTDVNALIIDLVTISRRALSEPLEIEIVFMGDPGMDEIIVNQDALKQILLNLIKNAIEATPASGKVTIATKKNVKVNEKQYVEINIADTGSGISPEIQKKLFQPEESDTCGERGIGLIIIKNLISEIGGLIDFKSSREKGTVFKVLIPR